MIQLINGNSLSIPLADGSVHMCVTSPPYWSLRDYGTATWVGGSDGCDHKPTVQPRRERERGNLTGGIDYMDAKDPVYRHTCGKCGAVRVDNQLGLEATPEEYVANMVAVFREVWRVLRNDGTCWVNLGDSYFSQPGNGRGGGSTLDGGQPHLTGGVRAGNLKPKDLVGIPWRVAFALQADGWYLRSDIIWHKPNPMPESVTDRPTKSHEYVFLLAKQPRYFYDADAIREPVSENTHARISQDLAAQVESYRANGGNKTNGPMKAVLRGSTRKLSEEGSGIKANRSMEAALSLQVANRNRRSVWTIPTRGFPGAHFATYPPALVEPCIKAGTSERGVCSECGRQWERVSDVSYSNWIDGNSNAKHKGGAIPDERKTFASGKRADKHVTTIGFRPTCTCDAGDPIPAIVLDPFNGAATTGLVAQQLGRRYVGLDLSAAYLQMSRERLGQTALDAWEDGEAAEGGEYDGLPLFGVV